MSLEEFIRLEAEAFCILRNKNPEVIWKAVECGIAEKIREFAESQDYEVNLDDIVQLIWREMCLNMVPQGVCYQ